MDIKYRVQISKDKKLLFTIDISALNSELGLTLIRERFRHADGFDGKLFVTYGEKRLLESSNAGIKVLASELEFELVSDLHVNREEQ